MKILQTKIKNATEISLRSDGSVDMSHVTGHMLIYALAKLIDTVGNKSLICVGLEEHLERGTHVVGCV